MSSPTRKLPCKGHADISCKEINQHSTHIKSNKKVKDDSEIKQQQKTAGLAHHRKKIKIDKLEFASQECKKKAMPSEPLECDSSYSRKMAAHSKSDEGISNFEQAIKSYVPKRSDMKHSDGTYGISERNKVKKSREKGSVDQNYNERSTTKEFYNERYDKLPSTREDSEHYKRKKNKRENIRMNELDKQNFTSKRHGSSRAKKSDTNFNSSTPNKEHHFRMKRSHDETFDSKRQYEDRQFARVEKCIDGSISLKEPNRVINKGKDEFSDRDRCLHAQKNTSKELVIIPSKSPVPDKKNIEPQSKRMKIEYINMKSGGAYIPPARLRMMQDDIKDKGSEQYQRIAWEALKKSIVGMTNKVNSANLIEIVTELFKENIIRGKGILARALMQAQAASPTFTRVYAALVAIINSKFPEIGELVLKRLIVQYKRGFRRNDKTVCMTAVKFLAHLLNQEVAHEVLLLEMVTHLLENPTDDSVEIAIATLKECGKKLTQLTANGMRAITQRVRDVLHEGNVDVRVRYMIEVFFAIQKEGFKDFEVIPEELDLLEEGDNTTHLLTLNFSSNDASEVQDMLNVFQFDANYIEKEEKYKDIVREILGGVSDVEECEEGSESEEEAEENQEIQDMTETNNICLRRKIYLTIQSSLDFEECCHKLLKFELKDKQILEMCYMIMDCCAQQRTYEKFFGLLAQRFCQLGKIYVEPFTEIFQNSYKTIHRLETNKLRNVAKFFAHLLYTDAISWMVLSGIKLNEEDTTSSSRIFIKILFQELSEYMGLTKINSRVKDITLQDAFEGLFPRDHPHNSRFAINFFTSIGLGGLTDELREHLKNLPKNKVMIAPVVNEDTSSSGSSSSSSSSSSSESEARFSSQRKLTVKRQKVH